ncbi:MAG: NusG domain II-containing protein [Desulfomonilaceae bacterium]
MREIFSKAWNGAKSIINLMTLGDLVIVGSMVLFSLALMYWAPHFIVNKTTLIEIISGERPTGQFSLNTDRMLEVDGVLGKTQVQIKDGRAQIVNSPCSNKYCVNMGQIGDSGGVLVCVPNEIIVKGLSGVDNGLDAVSR